MFDLCARCLAIRNISILPKSQSVISILNAFQAPRLSDEWLSLGSVYAKPYENATSLNIECFGIVSQCTGYTMSVWLWCVLNFNFGFAQCMSVCFTWIYHKLHIWNILPPYYILHIIISKMLLIHTHMHACIAQMVPRNRVKLSAEIIFSNTAKQIEMRTDFIGLFIDSLKSVLFAWRMICCQDSHREQFQSATIQSQPIGCVMNFSSWNLKIKISFESITVDLY